MYSVEMKNSVKLSLKLITCKLQRFDSFQIKKLNFE